MKLAHLAGISTFVTGGIGGVHRNGHVSMDVSADLTQLSRTPVVVVSAGIKSILDIARTLEVLETNSVPALGWQTDEFPAFFSPKSGVACPARVDHAEDVASTYWAARALDLPQGMLVAVPNHDPAGANVENAIQVALQEAEEQDIHGQAVTPFILKTVAEKTQGDSLRSNMALVKQNAEVGANIAIAIASSNKFFLGDAHHRRAAVTPTNKPSGTSIHAPKGSRNLAILRRSHDLRMSPMSPAQPVQEEIFAHADILVMDGGSELVKRSDTAKKAVEAGIDIIFIPSGVSCAITAFRKKQFLPCIKYAVVDAEEMLAISDGWTDSRDDLELAMHETDLKTIKSAASRTLKKMNKPGAHIMITLEDKGLLLASRDDENEVTFSEFPKKDGIEIRKGTAASDCLCGAFLHQLLEGHDAFAAATDGFNAVETLLSDGQSTYPLLSQFEARS
jgi:sugar/nucleoside kinase (ribokinase family)